MTSSAPTSRVLTLVFTDLVDSTALKSERGDVVGSELIARHREHVTRLAGECGGRIIDWAGDGCFLVFETPSTGVDFGLRLQKIHLDSQDLPGVRVGVHLGEVTDATTPDGAPRVEGLAVDLSARIQSLALPGQVLMSSVVFNSARQRLRGGDDTDKIEWRAHGLYEFKGFDEALEVCEAGFESKSPLVAPKGSEKAHRSVSPGEEDTLGWRPAVGLHVPGRPNWALQEQLGEGGFGEVWLAAHEKTRAKRVFKFCFESERVRGLKREVVLFRLLRESLGDREDIAQILDWEFDQPPFFIESEYTEGGDLKDWAAARGGIGQVPMSQRLQLVAQAARALGAAHSVGVLHKDIKPGNILVSETNTGAIRARLTDFGIGLLTDPTALSKQGITAAGMTDTLVGGSSSSHSGTRLYMAPEIVEGKPPTTRSDIYSLGVMLYQVVIGDLSHSLAPGWERDIEDEFVRADIAKCVDGKPENRFASAEDLADRIRSLDVRRETKEREEREHREAAETKRIAEQAKRRRKQFLVTSAIGITITIAVAGLALSEYQRAETQSKLTEELGAANAQLEDLLGELELKNAETEQALAAAQVAQRQAEYREYVSTIQLAGVRLDQQEVNVARAALLATPPRFRGWEWGFLVDRSWPRSGAGNESVPKSIGSTNAETWSDASARLIHELPSRAGLVGDGTFGRNQRQIVTANFSGTARIWSVADGSLTNEIGDVGGFPIYNARIIAQPPRLVTTSDNAILWDAATGTRIAELLWEKTDITTVVALSVDESLVAISFSDRIVRVFDTSTGDLVSSMGDASSHPTHIEFDPLGEEVAVSTGRGSVQFYDPLSGAAIRSVSGPVTGATIVSPAYDRAATMSVNRELTIWNLNDGSTVVTIEAGKVDEMFRNNVSFSPDGSIVAWSEAPPAAIRMVDATTGTDIIRLFSSGAALAEGEFSPDGTMFVAGSQDGIARVWQAYTATEVESRTEFGDFTDVAYQLAVGPRGERVAAVSYDGTAGVWDLDTGRKLFALEGHSGPLGSIIFVTDGDRLLTRNLSGAAMLWSAEDGTLLHRLNDELPHLAAQIGTLGGLRGGPMMATSALREPETSRDSNLLTILGASDLQIVDAHDAQLVARVETELPSMAQAIDATNTQLATSLLGVGIVIVFDLSSGEETARFEGFSGQLLDLEFSPDGGEVLAGIMDGTARILDVKTNEIRLTLEGHDGFLFSATYNRDGTRVLTAAGDNTARLWDAATGENLATFKGHANFVQDARFSPDERRVMTVSADGSIKVWDLEGNELMSFAGGSQPTFAVWTPDGSRIVSSWADGKIRVFNSVPWDELAQIGDDETPFEQRLSEWRGRENR